MSRIAEIEKLRSRMRQHHFVAISGPRNTGKSRICKELKSSLESELKNMREVERRFKAKAGMKWKVAYIKLTREDNPFDLLTQAIAGPRSNILFGQNEKVDPLFESKIKTILKRPDGFGLLHIYRQYLREKGYNFLIIVDQFENLFFSTILSQEEKHQFVRLLLFSSLEQRQLYVLVALRPPKADLWKTNFRELNRAIDLCRFRLYNPNQRDLERVIEKAFHQERSRLLGEESMDDLLSPDWLAKQDIYQRIALPRIRSMAEDTAEILQNKWKKILRDGGFTNNSQLVAPSAVKNITKQLRGIADTIWPQLLNAANIGYLDQEEREDIIIDLKAQLTEILTSEMLHRMSRHLAEELYFEHEPLVQIEKHVRQLIKDWSEVMLDIRAEQGRRRKRIKTVFLTEQKGFGAASGDLQFEPGATLSEKAEKSYNALKTSLDKRIARKAFTILGKTARSSDSNSMSIDDLTYAMGRFSTRLTDVLAVFIHAGVLLDEPKGDLLPTTRIELVDLNLIEKWTRLAEWVYDKAPGSLEGAQLGGSDAGLISGGAGVGSVATQVDMGLQENFGAVPDDTKGLIERGNQLYEALSPSVRKRVGRKILAEVGRAAQAGEKINSGVLKNNIGRFEKMVTELLEYFVRQGILQFSGPEVGFTDPDLVKGWQELHKWMKELEQ